MTYTLIVYAHVLLAVVLAGYGLFWVIVSLGPEAAQRDGEGKTLLERLARTPWPPRGLAPVSLPLVGLGWAGLIALVVTGMLLLGGTGLSGVTGGPFALVSFPTKLALVALLGVLLAVSTVRPSRPLALLFFLALLTTVALSALLVR